VLASINTGLSRASIGGSANSGGSVIYPSASADEQAAAQAAQAEEAASLVADAANEVSAVLTTVDELSPENAQAVTSALSGLFDAAGQAEGSPSSAEAAQGIANAVDQMARATASAVVLDANGTAPPVVLSSPNLNMTVNVRSAAALASEPVACASSTGEPIAVVMPTDVLVGVQVDLSRPVAAILRTSAVNLHTAPRSPPPLARAAPDVSTSAGTGRRRRLEGDTADNTTVSPTVTFSMLQEGRPLAIRDLSTPINISIPFRPSVPADASRSPCIGAPVDAEVAASCDMTVQCRFWNETEHAWSTDGCVTLLAVDGTIACSCDHLTEFIAFEFPTSGEELLVTMLASIEMNQLSFDAFECALNPGRMWRSIPAIWGCLFLLLAMFFGLLGQAVFYDRRDIVHIQALVAGRKLEEARVRELFRHKRSHFISDIKAAGRKHLHLRGSERVAPQPAHHRITAADAVSAKAATPPPSPPEHGVDCVDTNDDEVTHVDGPGDVDASSAIAQTADDPITVADVDHADAAAADAAADAVADAVADADALATREHQAAIMIQKIYRGHRARLMWAIAARADADGDGRITRLEAEAVAHEVKALNDRAGWLRRLGTSFSLDRLRTLRGRKTWATAKIASHDAVMAKRWHKDVDSVWKRLCISMTLNHTLCAGILYKGAAGYTRAQTCMILINSFAFELITLCLFYSAPEAPEEGEAVVTINPVAIVTGAAFAALITIPMMVSFAWLYDPILFVRMGRWVARLSVCWPCWLCACCLRLRGGKRLREQRELEAEMERQREAALASLIDVDNDGNVTRKEMADAARNLNLMNVDAELKSQLDLDGDGMVERGELQQVLEERETRRRAAETTDASAVEDAVEAVSSAVGAASKAVETAARPVLCSAQPAKALIGMGGGGIPAEAPSASSAEAPSASSATSPPTLKGGVGLPLPAADIESRGRLERVTYNVDGEGEPAEDAAVAAHERHYSFESLDDVLLKASLTQSWSRGDWPAVKKILFGWSTNILLFFIMLFTFALYGCQLFEPRPEILDEGEAVAAVASTGGSGIAGRGARGQRMTSSSEAGNTDELILSWALSAFQRFVMHEPTLILAAKGLPILFGSAFCMNCCGETIVNLLSLFFEVVVACIAEIKG